MNFELTARLLWASAIAREHSKPPPPQLVAASSPTDHSGRPTIQRPVRLRGDADAAPPPHSISAMRDIRMSVLSTPGHCIVGPAIREVIDDFLNRHPGVQAQCIAALGAPDVVQDKVISPDHLHQLRCKVRTVLQTHVGPISDDALLPSVAGDTSSCMVGGLLHAWARAAADPAADQGADVIGCGITNVDDEIGMQR